MKLKLSSRKPNLTLLVMLLLATLCLFAPDVMAQTTTEAQSKLCGVMKNVYSILKVASILVVTIAVIFAGYQIAFAHKRISDVAPILIGGLLIGAAAQIASMVIGNDGMKGSGDCAADVGGTPTSYVITAAPAYRA